FALVVPLTKSRAPRGRHEHELLHPARMADRGLGGDESAHRVAHQRGAFDADLPEEGVHEAAVAGDADLLPRQLREAEAGEVNRDDAMPFGEPRDVLEPVLPAPGEAMDEHDWRPVP